MPNPIITVDYESQVYNKPSINGVPLNHDKPLSAFNIQEQLNVTQMNAVNSGITSIDKQKYDNYENRFQVRLTAEQLQVLQSGITATLLQEFMTFHYLVNLPGYESGATQTLKNIQGHFCWVTDV